MKVAVIGSGGREHAILRKIQQDAPNAELVALPGNAGTANLARNVACDVSSASGLVAVLKQEQPDLTIVGPEIPLAAGLADACLALGIRCFGPTKAAAKLESSKAFAKQLMRAAKVPTAPFEIFTNYSHLQAFVEMHGTDKRWVVKADGLAAGKGAFVCDSVEETLDAAHKLLNEDLLGEAGRTVVLEERLSGRELSCMYLTDGESYRLLPVAQDYKRAFDDDRGANTGGMGSLCPSPFWNEPLRDYVEAAIIEPVLNSMKHAGTPYCGILYAGLMLTESGPQVIEFNCRLGDPETQTIVAVWRGNLLEHALACTTGGLATLPAATAEGSAVCVVLAADGYPDAYEKNIELRSVAESDTSYVLHAGTMRRGTSSYSTGGRVLNAIGVGHDLREAHDRAYALAEQLAVPGLRYRKDIAR